MLPAIWISNQYWISLLLHMENEFTYACGITKIMRKHTYTCMPHFILVLILTSGYEIYYTFPILVLFLVLRAVFDATSPMWRMDLHSMAMLRK